MNFSDINFVGHHLVGFVWPVVSQRTGERYDVILNDYGLTCDCIGHKRHNKCKHAQAIHDKLVGE